MIVKLGHKAAFSKLVKLGHKAAFSKLLTYLDISFSIFYID